MQLVGNLHSVTGYWSQFGTKWRLKSWCFQWSAASHDQTHLSVRADVNCACELFVDVPVACFFASRRAGIVVVYTPFLRPCWRNTPFTSFKRLVYPSSYLFLAWCYFVIKSQNVCDNGCKERRRLSKLRTTTMGLTLRFVECAYQHSRGCFHQVRESQYVFGRIVST